MRRPITLWMTINECRCVFYPLLYLLITFGGVIIRRGCDRHLIAWLCGEAKTNSMRMTYFFISSASFEWTEVEWFLWWSILLRSAHIIITRCAEFECDALIWSWLIAFDKNRKLNVNGWMKNAENTRILFPSCSTLIFFPISDKKSKGQRNGISSCGIENKSNSHIVTYSGPPFQSHWDTFPANSNRTNDSGKSRRLERAEQQGRKMNASQANQEFVSTLSLLFVDSIIYQCLLCSVQ